MLKKVLSTALLAVLVSACASTGGTGDESYQTVRDEKDAARVNKDGDKTVNVYDRIFFQFDSSSLTAEAKKVLDGQVGWLQDDGQIRVVVEGHCDDRGTDEYNLALGRRRANAVKEYLVSKGIAANRIKVVSFGKKRPEVVGTGERIWSQNRRAVTVIAE